MHIPSTRRAVTARVGTRSVMLPRDVSLPKGDYPAVVGSIHVALHGQNHDQTAEVMINLSAEFTARLGEA